jgi:hypothetical protein
MSVRRRLSLRYLRTLSSLGHELTVFRGINRPTADDQERSLAAPACGRQARDDNRPAVAEQDRGHDVAGPYKKDSTVSRGTLVISRGVRGLGCIGARSEVRFVVS